MFSPRANAEACCTCSSFSIFPVLSVFALTLLILYIVAWHSNNIHDDDSNGSPNYARTKPSLE